MDSCPAWRPDARMQTRRIHSIRQPEYPDAAHLTFDIEQNLTKGFVRLLVALRRRDLICLSLDHGGLSHEKIANIDVQCKLYVS